MNAKELQKVLRLHKLWICDDEKGIKANLRGANLRGANLRGANLRGANLYDADLYDADLYDANLCGANLRGANLCSANLRGANLYDADLYDANLCGANLHGANLCGTNLRGANGDFTTFFKLQCPESGAFTAYKKVVGGYILELLIPNSAKRSSAFGRKCRASKAKAVKLYDRSRNIVDDNDIIIRSAHDNRFVYELGKTYTIKDFDEDRFNECAPGIHFFITFEEARDY